MMSREGTPALTDVPGLLVGHAHDIEAVTGCTVVLAQGGAVCGVDIRGGGPSSRETDLMHPAASPVPVQAVALCGGSAFGHAAVTGVADWLYEHKIGYNIHVARIPIIPAAVILDLSVGRSDCWPDAAMGYAACENAGEVVAEGCVGVGTGATVGKVLGISAAMKSGVGTWSETLCDGTVVGALAVCNAFGDVRREHPPGGILAGVRDQQQGRFADARRLLREQNVHRVLGRRRTNEHYYAGGNTTLAVVATNARLSKAEATRLAMMAQDALPRMIFPIHTPFDGDAVFALSVGEHAAPHMAILGSVAADVLASAIERCVTQATSLAGLPSAHDTNLISKLQEI